jgi:hypothetical protein
MGTSNKNSNDSDSESESETELFIPGIPTKKASSAKIENIELEIPDFNEIAKKDTPEVKHVVVEDYYCNKMVVVPVPRYLVLDSKEPVVEISYIMHTPSHALIIQLDHDFQIRRQRSTPVIFQKLLKF